MGLKDIEIEYIVFSVTTGVCSFLLITLACCFEKTKSSKYKEKYIDFIILCFSPVNTLEKIYIAKEETKNQKKDENKPAPRKTDTGQDVIDIAKEETENQKKDEDKPAPKKTDTGQEVIYIKEEKENQKQDENKPAPRKTDTSQEETAKKETENQNKDAPIVRIPWQNENKDMNSGSYLVYHNRVIRPNDTFSRVVALSVILVLSFGAALFGTIGSSWQIENECPYSAHFHDANNWKCYQGQDDTYNCSLVDIVPHTKKHQEENITCIRWNFEFVLSLTMFYTLYMLTFFILRGCEALYNLQSSERNRSTVAWSLFWTFMILSVFGGIIGWLWECHYQELRHRFWYAFPIGMPVLFANGTRFIGNYDAMDTRIFQKNLYKQEQKTTTN